MQRKHESLTYAYDTQLNVRCGKAESDSFQTDIGVPQGDGLSANEFTLYLSNAIYNDKCNDHTYLPM